MKVSNVEEMRVLDKSAIEKFSISDELLMENAGLATCFVIQKELGIWGKRFWVFCGTGNNGGDGFVVARKIHSIGGKVEVFLLGEEKGFKGASKTNFEIVKKLPVPIKKLESLAHLKKHISSCDAIVDAIFGTGLMRNVEGLYKDVIQFVNQSGKKVFSIDIPSGINGNTGQPMGIAVEAFCTVTFGLPKIGNMLYPGYACCGKLYVSHISFPPSLYEKDSLKIEVNIPSRLPKRREDGHKGDFGDVLFIAGAANYFGAPYFAAESFLKAGGGYSRMGAPASLCPVIAQKGSEIVFAPQEETSAGSIALRNKGKLLELCEEVDMVVIGPGLSLNEETQELVRQLAPLIKKPLLIDGDGITAVAKKMDVLKKRKSSTIITPHLGEMARITRKSISYINENKINILQKTAKEYNAIIVLKGAHSLIGYPDGRVLINMSGNSGMATAGSGDVLTGTIAAMFGLGLSLEDAVKTGVFLHGFSGDIAAKEKGMDGMTAQDVLDCLPKAVYCYRDNYEEILKDFYQSLFVV